MSWLAEFEPIGELLKQRRRATRRGCGVHRLARRPSVASEAQADGDRLEVAILIVAFEANARLMVLRHTVALAAFFTMDRVTS